VILDDLVCTVLAEEQPVSVRLVAYKVSDQSRAILAVEVDHRPRVPYCQEGEHVEALRIARKARDKDATPIMPHRDDLVRRIEGIDDVRGDHAELGIHRFACVARNPACPG